MSYGFVLCKAGRGLGGSTTTHHSPRTRLRTVNRIRTRKSVVRCSCSLQAPVGAPAFRLHPYLRTSWYSKHLFLRLEPSIATYIGSPHFNRPHS